MWNTQFLEQGIITKTTKERMIALETEKDEIENNIKLELCKQRQPLKVETVRSFLYYFANEEYKSNDRVKEFFNGLINKVVLYDDKICIYYNTSPETADEVRMTEKKERCFLNFSPEKDDKIKCNPSKFKHYDITKILAEKISEAKIFREEGATDIKGNKPDICLACF